MDLRVVEVEVESEGENSEPLSDSDLQDLAHTLHQDWADINFIRGFIQGRDEVEGTNVEVLRKKVMEDYKDTVFSGRTTGNPPIRGEFGEAEKT